MRTDGGGEGWGNVDPTPGYSAISAEDVRRTIESLAPALRGLDAFNIRRALDVMDAAVPARFEAKAAVEMALLDAKGRAVGLPAHSLLGGKGPTDEVTLNAWIGTVAPEQAAREAAEWLRRGFATAKIKVSGAAPDGVERVAAVRAAVGDTHGAARGLQREPHPAESVAFIRRLEPYDLDPRRAAHLPHDLEALAEIRPAIDIPLMADESVTGPASLSRSSAERRRTS